MKDSDTSSLAPPPGGKGADRPPGSQAVGIDKSLATNGIAALVVLLGWLLPDPWRDPMLNIGLFAVSGGLTNWLAVHMLFERVPGMYGSGVIPARFEDFKIGIHQLIMQQFFTRENVARFLDQEAAETRGGHFDLGVVIDETDMNPAFDALVEVVQQSSFGSMLGMFGGIAAIEPLREPFADKLKQAIKEITRSDTFQEKLRSLISGSAVQEDIFDSVDRIVSKRLDELTPEMVKEIIQQMIRKHLGWLVVWGGVCGGAIGLMVALLNWSS